MPIFFIHVIVYVYFILVYFTKFRKYTETNGLGITIILLFAIVFAACTIFVLVNSFREKSYYIKAAENNASDELLNSENKSNITTDDIKLF